MSTLQQASLETPDPQEIAVIKPDRQMAIARFSPCGGFLVAGGYDALVHRWVLEEQPRELPPLAGHNGWVECVAFHPEAREMYTADSWGAIRCWPLEAEQGDARWNIAAAHQGWITCMAVSGDGEWLASCGLDRKIRVWAAADAKLHREFTTGEDLQSIAFHPREPVIVGGDLKGSVKQWNLDAPEPVRQFDASELYLLHRLQDCGGARRLAFDGEGTTLACAGTKPENGATIQGIPTVLLFDWSDAALKGTLSLGDRSDVFAADVAFLPQGVIAAATYGTPGRGKLVLTRLGLEQPLLESKKMQNCRSLDFHAPSSRLAVLATSSGSNGNGRRLSKEGEYVGNHTPIHIFRISPGDAAS